jgi:hypothetical protein
MKTILLWDPRFPDRRPSRLTVEDTVASAAVRAGVAAAANPAEAGALSAGGALDPTMLTEVVLQHGSGSATRRVLLPYSVVLVGAAAGVLAAIGTPILGSVTPSPNPAPSFDAQPSIVPNSAAVGQSFTGSDGTVSNGTVVSRRWMLNGVQVSTAAIYVGTAAGSLVYEVTATGAGGTTIAPSPAVTVSAAGTVYRIVALMGQSNMVGRGSFSSTTDTNQANVKQFPNVVSNTATYRTIRDSIYPLYYPEGVDSSLVGPGPSIGKAIASTLGANEVVLLVPCAWGNTSLVNPNANDAAGPPQWAVGRSLYEAALEQANAAVAAAKAINPASSYLGAAWVQGETDNSQVPATYESALRAHIADWRSRVTGGAGTPYVIGSMLPEKFLISTGHAAIDARQRAIAADLAGVSYVPGPYGRDKGDGTHYNSTGSRTEGTDMGRAMTGAVLVNFQRISLSTTEGNSGFTEVTYTVYRSNGSGSLSVPVVFGAGTTSPSDFDGGANPALTATWASGATDTTVIVRVKGDVDLESDETYTLTLNPASPVIVGSRPTVTGTIVNDDAAAPALDLPATTGLFAYHDASDRSTLYQDAARTTPVTATGQTVMGIADKSGNARHAVGVGSPVLGVIGTHDAITVNGTNQRFDIVEMAAMMTTESEFTIHTPYYATTEGNVGRAIWSSASAGTSRRTLQQDNASGLMRFAERDAAGTFSQPTFSTPLRGALTVLSVRRKFDGTVTVRRNGTEIYSGIVGPLTQTAIDAFYWGARRGTSSPDNYMLGQLGSMVAYNIAQADTDYLAVHEFLRSKWA